MILLALEDHASEFNIGDHVIVGHNIAIGSKDLFAIGYVRSIRTGHVMIENTDDHDCLKQICGENWEFAAKISSEFNTQLDDLLKTAEKTTDESKEAPRADAKICVSMSKEPGLRIVTQRAIAVTNGYSTFDDAQDAAVGCSVLSGHLFSYKSLYNVKKGCHEVISLFKHNDSCKWGGSLPKGCSHVYVTRDSADAEIL